MKYFKCGKCQLPYKIDETKVTKSQVLVTCIECGAKNKINFGTFLVAQSKTKTCEFQLKEGANQIGRKTKDAKIEILIDDEYVSRNHATIHIENKNNKIFIFIEDNNSLNGTFNAKKTKLKSGLKYPLLVDDYVIIGLTKLFLKIN
jgi:hypothetical protein